MKWQKGSNRNLMDIEQARHEHRRLHHVTRWFMRGVLGAAGGSILLLAARGHANGDVQADRELAKTAATCSSEWKTAVNNLLVQSGVTADGSHTFTFPKSILNPKCFATPQLQDNTASSSHGIEGTLTINHTASKMDISIAGGTVVDSLVSPDEMQHIADAKSSSSDIHTLLWAIGGGIVGVAAGVGLAEGIAALDHQFAKNNLGTGPTRP